MATKSRRKKLSVYHIKLLPIKKGVFTVFHAGVAFYFVKVTYA